MILVFELLSPGFARREVLGHSSHLAEISYVSGTFMEDLYGRPSVGAPLSAVAPLAQEGRPQRDARTGPSFVKDYGEPRRFFSLSRACSNHVRSLSMASISLSSDANSLYLCKAAHAPSRSSTL